MAVSADQPAVEHEAHDESAARDQWQADVGIDAEEPPQKEDGVHGQHQQAAMGEVDDVKHAVDQRQSDGDEHIDAAGQQPVQDAGEEDLGIWQTYSVIR